MKNYIILRKTNNYWLSNEHNNSRLLSIMSLITDYGTNADWVQRNIKKGSQEGVVGGSMEVIIDDGKAHIQPIFCSDAEDYRVTMPVDVLRFIVDRWQELISLKPDTIIIWEEEGQYGISAEFEVPRSEANIQA